MEKVLGITALALGLRMVFEAALSMAAAFGKIPRPARLLGGRDGFPLLSAEAIVTWALLLAVHAFGPALFTLRGPALLWGIGLSACLGMIIAPAKDAWYLLGTRSWVGPSPISPLVPWPRRVRLRLRPGPKGEEIPNARIFSLGSVTFLVCDGGLASRHPENELRAILMHEIGHYALGHARGEFWGLVLLGAGLGSLAGLLLLGGEMGFFTAFCLAVMLRQGFRLSRPLRHLAAWGREYQADAWVLARTDADLVAALRRWLPICPCPSIFPQPWLQSDRFHHPPTAWRLRRAMALVGAPLKYSGIT